MEKKARGITGLSRHVKNVHRVIENIGDGEITDLSEHAAEHVRVVRPATEDIDDLEITELSEQVACSESSDVQDHLCLPSRDG